MRIIKYFSTSKIGSGASEHGDSDKGNCYGVVEIGCGANAYWARQMHDAGIDILAFDAQLNVNSC